MPTVTAILSTRRLPAFARDRLRALPIATLTFACGVALVSAAAAATGPTGQTAATTATAATATNGDARSQTSAQSTVVKIENFTFTPATLHIAAGTTVTWKNDDDMPHTVLDVDRPARFQSPPLDTNDQFSYRFMKPGRYAYFCSIHPRMTGVIVVK